MSFQFCKLCTLFILKPSFPNQGINCHRSSGAVVGTSGTKTWHYRSMSSCWFVTRKHHFEVLRHSPILGGGFKWVLNTYPYLRKWSNLTNIFQMRCNHQLVYILFHVQHQGFVFPAPITPTFFQHSSRMTFASWFGSGFMVSPSNLSESFFCPNAKACPGGNRKCKTDQPEVFSALTTFLKQLL